MDIGYELDRTWKQTLFLFILLASKNGQFCHSVTFSKYKIYNRFYVIKFIFDIAKHLMCK